MSHMNSSSNSGRKYAIAVWMIAMGVIATWAVSSDMRQGWSYRTLEAKSCDVLMLLSGVFLLAAGLVYFVLARYCKKITAVGAVTVGAVAAGVIAVTLIAGVLTGVIPCSGPG